MTVTAEEIVSQSYRPADTSTDTPAPTVSTLSGGSVHPAATIFPMMSTGEIAVLAGDIRANGQREPIMYFRNQLLDGRNRLAACKLLGVEPEECEWSGGDDDDFDPYAYVVSVNLRRRHLDPSQRAAIAVAIENLFAADAKNRQREAGGDRKSEGRKIGGGNSATSDTRKARDKAAELVGVCPRYISDAKSIRAKDPEIFKQIISGAVTIPEARRAIKKAASATAPATDPPSHKSKRRTLAEGRPSALSIRATIAALKMLVQALERIGLIAECDDLLQQIRTRIEAARE